MEETEVKQAAQPSPIAPKTAPKAPSWAPSLLVHIFNPESRKVGFGYQVFGWATYGLFFARTLEAGGRAAPIIDTQTWLLCVTISGVLIGGGTLADAFHQREMAKIGGGTEAPNA